MIERQYGRLTIQCDSCGASDEATDGQSFDDFWKGKKRDGWRAVKSGEDWSHNCPECKR